MFVARQAGAFSEFSRRRRTPAETCVRDYKITIINLGGNMTTSPSEPSQPLWSGRNFPMDELSSRVGLLVVRLLGSHNLTRLRTDKVCFGKHLQK